MGFTSFPQCPSPISRSHPGCCSVFTCHIPLSLFDLRQFFTLSLFSIMLAVLRSAGHTVCKMFLSLHLPDFCSWVFGRKNALSPHQIRFTFYRHDFLLVMLVLLICQDSVCQFPQCYFSFSSILYPLEASH